MSPLPTGEHILNVDFLNDNTGFIVTSTFSVFKTTNGGNNWEGICALNQPRFGNDWMKFVNESTGFVSVMTISDDNKIYKTSNGGYNWFPCVNTNEVLWDGNFIDENTGFYIAEGKLYKTANSGINWVRLYDFGDPVHFVKFYNSKYGSVVRNGGLGQMELYLTVNGGNNWALVPSIRVQNVSYIDSNVIYLTNDSSRIYKSTNGGMSWEGLGISGQADRPTLFFENSLTGYTINSFPYSFYYTLMKTVNGGSNWINIVQTPIKPTPILDFTATNIYSVGQNGFISKSTDKGLNWFSKSMSIIEDVGSIYFKDENSGVVSGNKILKTENGGISWDTILFLDSIRLNYLQSPDNINLFAACTKGKFARSTNFGNNWTFINTGDTVSFSNVFFINSNIGFIFKNNSNSFYRTSDGGNNWILINQIQNIKDISFVDLNLGFAISASSGFLYKTTDSGSSWNVDAALPLNGQYLLNMVFNKDNSACISAGYQCSQTDLCFAIYRTTNSGISWNQIIVRKIYLGIYPPRKFNLQKTGNEILTAQYSGYGLKSTDKGATWEDLVYPYNSTDFSYFFPTSQIGYIAGKNVIAKTTNGGVVFINNNSSIVDKYFHLSQNYPNPFNPRTTINYTIPSNVKSQMSNVRITVYNALGKEIITLVNKKQDPGNYEVEFDGSNYPSGVYFYKLEADNFSETKRMVLLK